MQKQHKPTVLPPDVWGDGQERIVWKQLPPHIQQESIHDPMVKQKEWEGFYKISRRLLPLNTWQMLNWYLLFRVFQMDVVSFSWISDILHSRHWLVWLRASCWTSCWNVTIKVHFDQTFPIYAIRTEPFCCCSNQTGNTSGIRSRRALPLASSLPPQKNRTRVGVSLCMGEWSTSNKSSCVRTPSLEGYPIKISECIQSSWFSSCWPFLDLCLIDKTFGIHPPVFELFRRLPLVSIIRIIEGNQRRSSLGFRIAYNSEWSLYVRNNYC